MDLVMHKRISPEMKEVCAAFEDGMYLFAKSYEHMPWLLSETSAAHRRSCPIALLTSTPE